MDYESYYKNQIENPVFRGAVYQRGHGFGDVFKKFFRWIVPIVKQYAGPIASTVGKEALKSAINIANDSLDGKSFTTSSKDRFKESLNNLSTKIYPQKYFTHYLQLPRLYHPTIPIFLCKRYLERKLRLN